MNQHHEFGPSKYNAWAECPCWREKTDEKESAEASAGTRAHEEMSKCLTDPEYETDVPVAKWATDEIKALANGSHVLSEVRLVGTEPPLNGVFGTADAIWTDVQDGSFHIADLKTFSDGTVDYFPQLRGYAALAYLPCHSAAKVVLHVLHGMKRRVETVETVFDRCFVMTECLINAVRSQTCEPQICKWCQYCEKIDECKATNNAMTVVSENGMAFNRLSLCQKLVVCDAVVKLAESLKAKAKAIAEASDDKAIEMDGIRYELKTRAGRAKCDDICALASAVGDNALEINGVHAEGINSDEMIKLCTVSKSSVVDALVHKNAQVKGINKANVQRFVNGFFSPTEPTTFFTRTK